MHPSVKHVLQFFKHDHLSEDLQAIAYPFAVVAKTMAEDLPQNAETTVCLRKLLEAKDCAVRAFIAGEPD